MNPQTFQFYMSNDILKPRCYGLKIGTTKLNVNTEYGQNVKISVYLNDDANGLFFWYTM